MAMGAVAVFACDRVIIFGFWKQKLKCKVVAPQIIEADRLFFQPQRHATPHFNL